MIPQLEVSDACQTSGIQLTLEGNSETEFMHLKAMAMEWKAKMEWAWLTHNKALCSL